MLVSSPLKECLRLHRFSHSLACAALGLCDTSKCLPVTCAKLWLGYVLQSCRVCVPHRLNYVNIKTPASCSIACSPAHCLAALMELWLPACCTAPHLASDAGDLSYADGYQPRWDSFGRLIEPSAARVPWQVIEGNHEEGEVPRLSCSCLPALCHAMERWPGPGINLKAGCSLNCAASIVTLIKATSSVC